MYEPLVITTPAGGGREYKWLAQSYAWSKDGQTITLNIRRNVRWSDGKPLTAADVVYSLTAGQAEPDDGHPRHVPQGHERRLGQAEGDATAS